ncbi:hypothetical protein ACET3Z_005439 [Daucus carota]
MLLEITAQPYDRAKVYDKANVVEIDHVEKSMEAEVISDGEQGIFHESSSNIYSTNDEVCAVKEKRKEKDDERSIHANLGDDFIKRWEFDISDNDHNSEEE